ncbi:hypothetical protein K461DRAFT_293754 [Myriangium duriaei CBS 260.36]|uniref:Chromo domain-containing protein n=1 Tax=Myriangium duriaei CBS 260.36 TaxID=1168546 RepID=A0A9P4MHT7_9PEZI|nr:hypothetical protein K461DRAFT_293754 [Myriangium duriaei CBS 260.36]
MPPKRKALTSARSSKKRAKRADHWDLDDPEVYEVKEILDERTNEYLISWAPNRITGEEYPPDWNRKEYVNLTAIEDWERKKKIKRSDELDRRTPPRIRIKIRGYPKETPSVNTESSTTIDDQNGVLIQDRGTSAAASSARRNSRKVVESSPVSASTPQQHISSSLTSSGPSSSSPQPPSADPTPPKSRNREVRIELSPLRPSQRAQYAEYSNIDFDSSQVISGTAPEQRRDGSSEPHSTQTRYIDAGAAPDLTQQHSEYDNVDTSKSTSDPDQSAEVSTSSQPKDSSDRNQSSIIPDSQSGLGSLLYIAPTQSDSQTITDSSIQGNIVVNAEEDADDISDWSVQSKRAHRRATTASQLEIIPTSGQPGQSTSENHSSHSVHERDFADQSRPVAPQSVTYISSGTDRPSQSEQLTTSDSSVSARSATPHSAFQSLRPSRKSSSQRDSLEKITNTKSGPQPLIGNSTNNVDLSRRASNFLPASLPASPSPPQNTPSKLASPFRSTSRSAKETPLDRGHSKGTSSASIFDTQISTHLSNPIHGGQAQKQRTDLFGLLGKARENQAGRPLRPTGLGFTLDTTGGTFPRPPSQYPETFDSAPSRPKTLSPTTPIRAMSSASPQSATSEASLRIQELREAGGPITPAQRSLGMTTRSSANRPGSPAILREARSPSMVPSAEVVPMPTEEENRTSERYLTLFPDKPEDAELTKKTLPHGITDDSSVDGQTDIEMQTNNSHVDKSKAVAAVEGPLEFVVPIFFLGQQRDHYKQSIVWQKKFLENFMLEVWPEDSPMITKAKELIERLRQVTSHPDLMNEESFSQDQMDARVKAQWDRGCSTKFRFVESLLSELAQRNIHVVIDIEAGRLLNIMDNFLTGLGAQHVTAGSGNSFTNEDTLRVTLLPKHFPANLLPKADLVVAFEGSVELIEDQRAELRKRDDKTVAPLLYLVVPKTVEHIERYLSEARYASLSPIRRLTILVENTHHLRLEAGYRQEHDQDSKNSAASIAKFVSKGCRFNDWPIDELPSLSIRDSYSDSQATTVSDVSVSSAPKTSKRPLDDDSNQTSTDSKKMRIDNLLSPEMPSTINPATLSLSAITDSVDRQAVAASEYVSELASLRHEHELALQQKTFELETRLQEHIVALEDLQYRYEELRIELVNTRQERDEAYQSASLATTRVSSRDTLVGKIQAEREEYKRQLAETKAALQSHAVPEVAALEALKLQIAEAEKEKGKMEAKVKSLTQDLEYIRSLYQDVSTRGAQMAEEKNELESRVADLEKRASDNVATTLRLAKDTTHKQLHGEINRLRIMLTDRDKVLQQRDEEITKLREKERGRMGTRGGSVPRSPGQRLGSPMRLEPPRSSGVGSRATSPRRGSPAAGVLGSAVKSRLGR